MQFKKLKNFIISAFEYNKKVNVHTTQIICCTIFSIFSHAVLLLESWEESYLNFYDALTKCRLQAADRGFEGDLAKSVRNFESAKRFCKRARGGCAPSLVRRENQCYQWSPIDGSEMEIPCGRNDITMRYICEIKP